MLYALKPDQTGRHERRWILSLDERLLARIRNNAVINRQPNMAAQTFCDYIIKEVLPEVAATKENAEEGYDPFKNAPITKIKNEKDEVISYAITERTARSWLASQAGMRVPRHEVGPVLRRA